VAARGPRALALAARCADGWEASFLAPAAFAEAAARVDAAVATSARPRAAVGRSVELDVALGDTPAAAATAVERFCAVRGIPRTHALLGAALVGDRDAVVARVSAYARAGATDLLLAFSDFPQTTMLERFAQRVLPVLTAADRLP
jgi:alkanesulfonate monooxygenase SsuD/methylene tetrahydromethanopterin reductase-like flavin-dependent oxidoreductase (luciferase family)